MIEDVPNWMNVVFLLTVGVTILMFYFANGKKLSLLIAIVVWAVVQSFLAYKGFYQVIDSFPPRFMLVLLPPTLFIAIGLLPKYRNSLIEDRNLTVSTFMHMIRVPVEIVLFYLFVYKMIPELMTFEGRNFDIIAGITAPIIGLLIFTNKANKNVLIAWNSVALCLVLSILFNGILSTELPFQQFAFEQPNRALFYFPFVLLPAVIVPIVIYTHITDLIILINNKR